MSNLSTKPIPEINRDLILEGDFDDLKSELRRQGGVGITRDVEQGSSAYRFDDGSCLIHIDTSEARGLDQETWEGFTERHEVGHCEDEVYAVRDQQISSRIHAISQELEGVETRAAALGLDDEAGFEQIQKERAALYNEMIELEKENKINSQKAEVYADYSAVGEALRASVANGSFSPERASEIIEELAVAREEKGISEDYAKNPAFLRALANMDPEKLTQVANMTEDQFSRFAHNTINRNSNVFEPEG